MNGVVWEQVVVGDVVYVAGSFTTARPFGAQRGVNETPRSNVLAYDLRTGALLPFAPTFNSTVYSLAASPDGKRLYAGGIFTKVNDQARYRIAAFDLPSNQLVAGFRPIVNQKVQAMIATNDTLFVGGTFVSAGQRTGVAAVARASAAAFTAADATVLPWAPRVQDGRVLSMVMSPSKDKIVLGGTFRALNGSSQPGWTMGAVDVTVGASLPWKVNATVPDRTDFTNRTYDWAVYGLSADDEYVYGSMGPGSFEGTWQARWSDGSIGWLQDCHGDSYASYSDGEVVYTASHAHDCSNIGGFTDFSHPKGWYRGLAMTREATQKVGPWNGRYRNYAGQPAPSLLNWYPEFDTGPTTGQGPWDITGSKGYVLVAGEFSKLNGKTQEGLARFAPRSTAPNKVGPQLAGAEMKPAITSIGATEALVRWGLNFDWDDARLTYQVIRDGELVHEFDYASQFWKWRAPGEKTAGALTKPGARIDTLTWLDEGLEIGREYVYQIRTVDPYGNTKLGDPTAFVKSQAGAALSPRTPYDSTVLDAQPSIYWPFNEPSGYTAYDAGFLTNASAISGRADGVEADPSGRAYDLRSNAWAAAEAPTKPLQTYSSELWFNTTTKAGGQLIGMASSRDTTSAHDRQVYMDDAGRIWSANYDGDLKPVSTTKSFNDGKWHHVVNTLGADGLKLYVDGVLQASRRDTTSAYTYGGANAYWNLGAHTLGGRPSMPSSIFFTGRLDNVAIYPRVLDADTVRSHFEAATAQAPNVAPQAGITTSVDALTVSVDGSKSSDQNDAIASYAWDFGDGSTGTGVTASHTYAKSGSYTVKLTVTDGFGATHTTAAAVSVAVAGLLAEDGFDRAATAAGWGRAGVGGPWTLTGGASGFSTDGKRGVIVNAAGATRSALLNDVSARGTDSVVSFSIAQKATAAQYVSVIGRHVGSSAYSARVVLQPDGKLQVQLLQSGVQVGKTVNAGTYTVGQSVSLRLQVSGSATTTLSAKAWTSGVTEPTQWQATATDTTPALQAPGAVGLKLYVGGSGATTSAAFDDYRVTAIG